MEKGPTIFFPTPFSTQILCFSVGSLLADQSILRRTFQYFVSLTDVDINVDWHMERSFEDIQVLGRERESEVFGVGLLLCLLFFL